jgi:pumilio RNA-binding family
VDDEEDEEVAIEQIKRLTRSAKLSGPDAIGIDAEEDAQLDANLLPEASGDPVILALSNVDSEDFRPTLDRVMSSVWPLATTKNGCRIIQKAIEVGSQADRSRILDQLRGHVHEALKSPHANHVLHKCIEIMPPDLVDFVLIELQGEGAYVARHRFGCRILQRLIEHCSHQQTEGLIAEVLSDASRLCRHQYGNFVIQHILQHGAMAHRHIIAEALCEDTIRLAKHRIASHVLSCAMVHCDSEDVQRLTKVVLDDAGQLADLSRRQYGSFVVREVNRAARMLQA